MRDIKSMASRLFSGEYTPQSWHRVFFSPPSVRPSLSLVRAYKHSCNARHRRPELPPLVPFSLSPFPSGSSSPTLLRYRHLYVPIRSVWVTCLRYLTWQGASTLPACHVCPGPPLPGWRPSPGWRWPTRAQRPALGRLRTPACARCTRLPNGRRGRDVRSSHRHVSVRLEARLPSPRSTLFVSFRETEATSTSTTGCLCLVQYYYYHISLLFLPSSLPFLHSFVFPCPLLHHCAPSLAAARLFHHDDRHRHNHDHHQQPP